MLAEEERIQSSNEIEALRAELSNQKQTILKLDHDKKEDARKRLALQQWKTQKTQLLASLNDQAKLWEKIKHLDIEQVIADHETHSEIVSKMERTGREQARINELQEQRLRSDIKAIHKQLEAEKRVKNDAMAQLMYLQSVVAQYGLEIPPMPVAGGDHLTETNGNGRSSNSSSHSHINSSSSSSRRPGSAMRRTPSSPHMTSTSGGNGSGRKKRPESASSSGYRSRAGSASSSRRIGSVSSSRGRPLSASSRVRPQSASGHLGAPQDIAEASMQGERIDKGDSDDARVGGGGENDIVQEYTRRLSSNERSTQRSGFGSSSRRGEQLFLPP